MLERPIYENEARAIIEGKIPAFDKVGRFTLLGLKKTLLHGKMGVINRQFQIVLDNDYDDIKFEHNTIIALSNHKYKIYTHMGNLLTTREFDYLHEAQKYASFF